MSLLVVGSVALDSVETPYDKIDDALGGSATYISLAASYFSTPVELIGVVGSDFPKSYIEMLKHYKIGLEGLQIIGGEKTFRWGGKYHHDLNIRDTLFTELNAFENFNPIIEYQKHGQAINLAVPSPDHYLPLIYTLGLRDTKDKIQLFIKYSRHDF